MADPPWRFDHTMRGPRSRGGAAIHYDTMDTDAIAAIAPPVADEAHLYLWTTNAHLIGGDAARVCIAWGFVPMTLLTWVKSQLGIGYYFRPTTEHVLFGVRGRLPAHRHDLPTHFSTSERLEHSVKPDGLLWIAEQQSPGPRLELFARRRRDGWDVLGDQAPQAAQMLLG